MSKTWHSIVYCLLLYVNSILAATCSGVGGSGTTYKDTSGISYTVRCNKDLKVTDLSSVAATDYEFCFNKCSTNSNCRAVSFFEGKCWLKALPTDQSQPFTRASCDLAYRVDSFTTPSCATLGSSSQSYTDQNGAKYDLSCNTNIDGSDIRNVLVSGYEDCFYQCGSTTGCQGFTYIRSSKRCYLKKFASSSAIVPTTNNDMDSSLVSGLLPQIQTCQQIADKGGNYTTSGSTGRQYRVACESDMNGSGDIGSVAASTFSECLQKCDSTSNCVAATYYRASTTCYMKSIQARDVNPSSRPGFDFGYLSSLAGSSGTKAETGSWGAQINFPLIPMAAAYIPRIGKLLVWSSAKANQWTSEDPNAKFTLFADYDPATGAVSSRTVSNTGHDMFCPGISSDVNGRLIISGGSTAKVVSIFDPATNSFIRAGDLQISRGYQSSTTLSNGKVFTIGGSWSGGRGGKIGELYDTSSNTWTSLQGCPVDPILTADQEGVYRSDNHAWLFGWKNGAVFQAGPSKAMNWFGTSGTGSITSAGNRGSSQDSMSGQAVMYDIGKILTAGGSPSYSPSPASKSANIITLGNSGSSVQVEAISDMAYPRALANSVVLPNGEVLITGGQTYAEIFTDNNPTQYPELWSPTTKKFKVLEAKEPSPRTYHSVSILLPDGTVFSAGGGACGDCGSNNHFDGRIFTPPYLFRQNSLATRPIMNSVSATTLKAGARFTVSVKISLSSAATFSLLRVGTVTHSINTDQRRIPLVPAARSGEQYDLILPSDYGVLLPGYYYLFALDDGVPSIAKTVQVIL